jgi:hypothetical protein
MPQSIAEPSMYDDLSIELYSIVDLA